jgi:hypothetical protein
MKIESKICVALVLTLFASHPAWSGEAAVASTNKPAATPTIVYRAAKGSVAAARVTGGSRGTGISAVTLDVLAPDEVGLTTQEQPSLFWYQSQPATAKFELTLLQDNQIKPLVQVQVDRADKTGIQRLNLADQGAKLVPGVEYKWVAALVTDSENRSKDLVASGVIKRIEPTAELKEKISAADPAARPTVYAEAGIWYDALSSLSDQIDAHPADSTLRQTRADLLRQVGLKAAAKSDLAAN